MERIARNLRISHAKWRIRQRHLLQVERITASLNSISHRSTEDEVFQRAKQELHFLRGIARPEKHPQKLAPAGAIRHAQR
jgi:hypothetical protein